MKRVSILIIITLLALPSCQHQAPSPAAPRATSTPQETKWLTYSDASSGYDISYPSDWAVQPVGSTGRALRIINPDGVTTVLILVDSSGTTAAHECIDVLLWTIKTIQEDNAGEMYAELLSDKEMVCSNLPAREITFLIGEEHAAVGWHRTLSVGKDNYSYSVSATCPHYQQAICTADLDKIFSSFHITTGGENPS